MSNNVVLGDLSKYKGNDALNTDNDGFVAFGLIPSITKLSASFTIFDYTPPAAHIIGAETGAKFSFDAGAGTIGFLSSLDGITWDYSTQHIVDTVNGINTVDMEYIGTTLTVTINDVVKVITDRANAPTAINPTYVASREGSGSFFYGVFSEMSINDSYYIQNGDFGDATLIDHSGNGNDGTINGATWWKQGINEVFATAQLYKSSWIIPMEDDQRVTYVDDSTIFYETTNVFWNPYNQDLVYTFNVRQQDKLIKQLLITTNEEYKMVRKTVKGSTLGTGIKDFKADSEDYPSYVLATSDGIMRVRYTFDNDYTDITIISDGTMYPIGVISAIDIDNSTVVFADIVLGIE